MGLSYFFRMLGNEISYEESHPSQVTQDLTNKISNFFDAIARVSFAEVFRLLLPFKTYFCPGKRFNLP